MNLSRLLDQTIVESPPPFPALDNLIARERRRARRRQLGAAAGVAAAVIAVTVGVQVLSPAGGPGIAPAEPSTWAIPSASAPSLPTAWPTFTPADEDRLTQLLHERVAAEGGGWVLDEHRDVDAILDELAAIFSVARSADFRAKRDRVRGIRLPSLADMADRTAEVYRRTPESPAAFPALSNRVMTEAAARARDAQEPGSWRTLLAAAASGTRARPGTASTAEPAATA